MVRSVLALRAKPGRRDEVVALFERIGILREASAVPGFVSAEVQVAADAPDELLVTATWESAAAYEAWLASPVRGRMAPALETLLAEPPGPGRVYDIVQTQ
jgi:quinol monooxygenase YgiN